jgi:hypothetical protein
MGDKITTGAAYSTSVATFITGLTVNDWAAIAGIIGVFGTLAMNLYFKSQANKRARELHALAVSGALDRRAAQCDERDDDE